MNTVSALQGDWFCFFNVKLRKNTAKNGFIRSRFKGRVLQRKTHENDGVYDYKEDLEEACGHSLESAWIFCLHVKKDRFDVRLLI